MSNKNGDTYSSIYIITFVANQYHWWQLIAIFLFEPESTNQSTSQSINESEVAVKQNLHEQFSYAIVWHIVMNLAL